MNKKNLFVRQTSNSSRSATINSTSHGAHHGELVRVSNLQIGRGLPTRLASSTNSNNRCSESPTGRSSYNCWSYRSQESALRPLGRKKLFADSQTGSWGAPISPYVADVAAEDVYAFTLSSGVGNRIERLHRGLPSIRIIPDKPVSKQNFTMISGLGPEEMKNTKPKHKAKKAKDDSPTHKRVNSKDLSSEQVDTLLQMADMFDQMKTRVTDHDERMGEYQAILGQVENAVQGLRKTLGTCQLIWKIDGFKGKFKDASKGENTVLYSPAFETHPYGYKLALSLCPYGDGVGKGKFMSIFFTVLQGQWDSLLHWPFGHKVTFTLLDQSESQATRDIKAYFEPNPIKENMPFLGKPSSYRNPSLGLPKFAPLTELWTGEKYVKDNTIFIKVEVDLKDAAGI